MLASHIMAQALSGNAFNQADTALLHNQYKAYEGIMSPTSSLYQSNMAYINEIYNDSYIREINRTLVESGQSATEHIYFIDALVGLSDFARPSHTMQDIVMHHPQIMEGYNRGLIHGYEVDIENYDANTNFDSINMMLGIVREGGVTFGATTGGRIYSAEEKMQIALTVSAIDNMLAIGIDPTDPENHM